MPTAREAILECAVRHFADQGYGGASLREILRDAGVNAAAAHHDFGSKEPVTEHLSRPSEERRVALQSIEANLDPQQRLERLVRATACNPGRSAL